MSKQQDVTLEMFVSWANETIGTVIRGQRVADCAWGLDTLGDGDDNIRVILSVYFEENPLPDGMDDDERLLARVFSDVPTGASLRPLDTTAAVAVMTQKIEPPDWAWFLDDESKVAT